MLRFLLCAAVWMAAGGGAMAQDGTIKLPEPDRKGRVTLEESIVKRRSVREFTNKGLTFEQLGQLLWSLQGVTASDGHRSAPSAGATYPLEIYVATKDGFYHYAPATHTLELLDRRDIRRDLSQASLGQTSVSEAAADFIVTAVYGRVAARYGNRADLYVPVEVGHAAQNLHLQAVALGLGSVPVGAFDPKAVRKICSLPEDREALYIVPVGYPKVK